MKTIIIASVLGALPLALPAAESDQSVGTCFAYMIQNGYGNGARIVARKTTDLEAAQYYVLTALRSKVTTSDGVASCTKLGIDMRPYKPVPVMTATQKE